MFAPSLLLSILFTAVVEYHHVRALDVILHFSLFFGGNAAAGVYHNFIMRRVRTASACAHETAGTRLKMYALSVNFCRKCGLQAELCRQSHLRYAFYHKYVFFVKFIDGALGNYFYLSNSIKSRIARRPQAPRNVV